MMNKILLSAIITILLVSCTKNESFRDTKGLKMSKEMEAKIPVHGYKGQLPYYSGDNMQAVTRYNAEHDWEEKVHDPKLSWRELDSAFSDTLANEVQQEIAVDILAGKDLISLARLSPENKEYQAALKQNITVLTAQKYIGFCLLYEALAVLDDTNLRKRFAKRIIDYSMTDVFHLKSLNDPDMKDTIYRMKIEENYGYLERIRRMAE